MVDLGRYIYQCQGNSMIRLQYIKYGCIIELEMQSVTANWHVLDTLRQISDNTITDGRA